MALDLVSESLEADGIHSRIDALVSAGAFVGIGLAGLGLEIADPIVGILITVAIVLCPGRNGEAALLPDDGRGRSDHR